MKYSQTTAIKSWAEEDRPREKLKLKGKSSLSNAELLAIILGSGSQNESAVQLSKSILHSIDDNLIELSRLNMEELMHFSGIGEAKSISIIAALELGRRYRSSDAIQRKKVTSSIDAYEAIYSYLSDQNFEQFYCIFLNRANEITSIHKISEGGSSGTVVDPKKIFKTGLLRQASSIILCHNHPSGNIQASHQDKSITKNIKTVGELMDMPVIDHIIVGKGRYLSFADEGYL